jgi:hypothetical protein
MPLRVVGKLMAEQYGEFIVCFAELDNGRGKYDFPLRGPSIDLWFACFDDKGDVGGILHAA